MEGPPYQYDGIVDYIENETLPQNGAIELLPFAGEAGRTVAVTYGTIAGREVLMFEEWRDHGREAGNDTYLRKRTLIVDPATAQIMHLSNTRTSRQAGEDHYIYISNGFKCVSDGLSAEIESAYRLVQDIYQYGKNPPLPQTEEAVEER